MKGQCDSLTVQIFPIRQEIKPANFKSDARLAVPEAAICCGRHSNFQLHHPLLTIPDISFEVHTWLSKAKAIYYFMNWHVVDNSNES